MNSGLQEDGGFVLVEDDPAYSSVPPKKSNAFLSLVQKFNENHDELGRFAESDGSGSGSSGDHASGDSAASGASTHFPAGKLSSGEESDAELLSAHQHPFGGGRGGGWVGAGGESTSTEVQAIFDYQGQTGGGLGEGGYARINGGLRSGGSLYELNDKSLQAIAVLDGMMRPSVTDATLYRGFNLPEETLKDWARNPSQLVGKIMSDKGFSSSSSSRTAAREFKGVVLLTINAPKGTSMIDVNGVHGNMSSSLFFGEHEFILPRDTKIEITGASYHDFTLYVKGKVVQ